MITPLCPHCSQPMLLYRNSDSDRMLHRTFFCACRNPLTWHNELTKRTGTILEVLDDERTK